MIITHAHTHVWYVRMDVIEWIHLVCRTSTIQEACVLFGTTGAHRFERMRVQQRILFVGRSIKQSAAYVSNGHPLFSFFRLPLTLQLHSVSNGHTRKMMAVPVPSASTSELRTKTGTLPTKIDSFLPFSPYYHTHTCTTESDSPYATALFVDRYAYSVSWRLYEFVRVLVSLSFEYYG